MELSESDDVQLTITSVPGSLESSSVVYHTSQGHSFIGQSGSAGRLLSSANPGDLVVGHRTGGAIILSADVQHQEKHLTVLESGNIGIGTDNPTTAMEIIGQDDVQLTISSSSGDLESSAVVHHTSQGHSFIGQSGTSGRLLTSANAAILYWDTEQAGQLFFLRTRNIRKNI